MVNPGRGFPDVEAVKEAFDILEKNGCKTVDTAALYGESESRFAQGGHGTCPCSKHAHDYVLGSTRRFVDATTSGGTMH